MSLIYLYLVSYPKQCFPMKSTSGGRTNSGLEITSRHHAETSAPCRAVGTMQRPQHYPKIRKVVGIRWRHDPEVVCRIQANVQDGSAQSRPYLPFGGRPLCRPLPLGILVAAAGSTPGSLGTMILSLANLTAHNRLFLRYAFKYLTGISETRSHYIIQKMCLYTVRAPQTSDTQPHSCLLETGCPHAPRPTALSRGAAPQRMLHILDGRTRCYLSTSG